MSWLTPVTGSVKLQPTLVDISQINAGSFRFAFRFFFLPVLSPADPAEMFPGLWSRVSTQTFTERLVPPVFYHRGNNFSVFLTVL